MSELVLVVGASGPTGRHVVSRLLERGYAVRGMSRDVGAAQAANPAAAVEWVAGDLRDAEQVGAAIVGVQHVLITSGTRNWFGAGDNTGREVDLLGVEHVLRGARAVRFTGRIGYVSSVLVTRAWRHPVALLLNLVRGGVLSDKWAAEQLLRSSGLDYGIVRPGALNDEAGGLLGLRLEQGDRVLGSVSREDVARVLVAWLERPSARRVTFELVNGGGAATHDAASWDAVFRGLHADP